MAISFGDQSCLLATRTLKAWLGEHPQFLEESPATAGRNGDRNQWRLQKVADWQEFRNFCQRLAGWPDQLDSPKSDPGSLRQFPTIVLPLGSPSELCDSALLLCNKLLSEIGMPRAARGAIVNEQMSKPLTLIQWGVLFNIHRNHVMEEVILKFPHELIAHKYRLPVSILPPEYAQMIERWSIPRVTKNREKS